MFKPNSIICGDCEDVLKKFPDECIDLIYADPPFFTQKNYEIIWGDGSEIRAFEDRWKGGKKGIYTYIEWMRPKIEQIYRVLKKTGSFYLHCDWHASHYLKVLCDEIFGYERFQNEIIWCYKGGYTTKRFRRKHDTILFYTKSDEYTFNIDDVRIPYSEEILKYTQVDSDGRRYYKTGQKGSKGRVYLHPKGQLPYDYWIDIPCATTSHGREMMGYPTQKPEKLLERIIKASSNPTDIVLDPFCGCGTAIAVAHKLGRRWIGIDISPTACRLMVKRMQKLGVRITERDVIGMPMTEEELKSLNPLEFQNWICQKINARISARKSGDMGIDGWVNTIPIQIKQSERVGRNVVDNFETALRRVKKKKGIIVAFSFTKGAYAEVARAGAQEGVKIRLITVRELLDKNGLWLEEVF